MCRVQKPGEVIRPLIIEVFNNGKVSIVPDTMEGSELTIDELAACRDLIDLIIANPKNFHIVKTDPPVNEINTCDHIKMPLCRECKNELTNNTEFFTGICFDCEKVGILQRSNIQSTVINDKFKKLTEGPIDGCTPVEGRDKKACPFCKADLIYTPAYLRGWCMVCKDGKEHSSAEYAALLVAPIDGNAGQSSTMDDLDRIMADEPGYSIDAGQVANEEGEIFCKAPGCKRLLHPIKNGIAYKRGTCVHHKGYIIG